jgi:hypothetical protein
MKYLKLYILLIFVWSFISCQPNKKKAPTDSLTLIVLGLADSFSKENSGYGINFYSCINLDNNSVFQESKFCAEDSIWKEVKSGSINNLSTNDTLISALKALENFPNGNIKETEIPEGTLYCGLLFYLEYKQNDKKQYFLFRDHKQNSSVKNLVHLILEADKKNQFSVDSKSYSIKEDSLINLIVKSKGINLMPMPRAVKPDVIFEAP